MSKRIQLTESQILDAIREAFEDNQDWRTDMLKGKKKMRQWLPANRMSNDEFRSPEARKRYWDLGDKRWKEAHDLTRSAQNKFNKDVKYFKRRDDWEFEPFVGREYKGTFRANLPCVNLGVKGWNNNKMTPYDWSDTRAIEDFVGEKCYFDDELDKWVEKDDPSYDEVKAQQFWQAQGFGESIVRRVTENVIRKLSNINEEYKSNTQQIVDGLKQSWQEGVFDDLKIEPYFQWKFVIGTNTRPEFSWQELRQMSDAVSDKLDELYYQDGGESDLYQQLNYVDDEMAELLEILH